MMRDSERFATARRLAAMVVAFGLGASLVLVSLKLATTPPPPMVFEASPYTSTAHWLGFWTCGTAVVAGLSYGYLRRRSAVHGTVPPSFLRWAGAWTLGSSAMLAFINAVTPWPD